MLKNYKAVAALMLAGTMAACGGGGGSAGTTATGAGTGTNTGTPGSTDTSVPPPTTPTGEPVTAASAVSVSIGYDGTIGAEAVSALKYSKKFVVTVVDQQGRPVAGATVQPHVEMVEYAKGFWDRDPTTSEIKAASSVRKFCPAEDRNNNDVLDAGEDLNGDGILTPPRSIVAIIATDNRYTTDNTGSVIFELQYPKNYATWIVPALVVKASVTGTEGSARMEYVAGFAAGDEKQPGIPFVFSPFSTTSTTTPSCTNNL